MKLLFKAFTMILCICLCVSLSSCNKKQNVSSVDDSYLDGLYQGREDFFLDLLKAAYNPPSAASIGELWETDDFSLKITAKRGLYWGGGIDNNEDSPYIEIDFDLNGGTLEGYYELGEILFSIYSYGRYGWTCIWDSDYYYDYFLLNDSLDVDRGKADVGIYEGTVLIAVLIVVNDNIYTACYDVDI